MPRPRAAKRAPRKRDPMTGMLQGPPPPYLEQRAKQEARKLAQRAQQAQALPPPVSQPQGAIRLKYTPFAVQKEFHEDAHRFRVLDCGRRWGKSVSAIHEAFLMLRDAYLAHKRPGRIWVVAPTFPLVREDWRIAEEWLPMVITEKKQTEMAIHFGPFGEIEFKSAERDDEGLRGAGLDGVVVDEAARVSEKSWTMGLRPALADRLGRAVFISTPKGRNWFYDLYQQGQQPNGLIRSWKLPTNERPSFSASEWQTILATTPEMVLKQEYLAEFLENEGAVFHGISRCLRGELQPEPSPTCRYLIGVDLAKTHDWTVFFVLDRCHKRLAWINRYREVDWSAQKKLLMALGHQYNNAELFVDSSGVGDPIEEDLRKQYDGVVRGFKFTSVNKQNLVEELMVVIETGLVGLPDVPETAILLDELRDYAYEILNEDSIGSARRVRYGAPSGKHDDCVMAMALACYAARFELRQPIPEEKAPTPETITLNDYIQLHERPRLEDPAAMVMAWGR